MLSGPFAALAVESEPYVNAGNILIRKVKKIILVPLFSTTKQLSSIKQNDEDLYIELLYSAFREHNLFFSNSFDLTQSQQRISKFSSKQLSEPLWTRADNRFFWNKEVVRDLIACSADEWIIPFMSAHIEFQPGCDIENEKFSIIFISRRSRFRQGCRFTKRGIDDKGHVANFVETEQILLFSDNKITSYVQIRGSIPVYWWSPVHMKYAPKVNIHDNQLKSIESCEKHVVEVLHDYADHNGKSGITFVNLIDGKKEQGNLAKVFKEVVDSVRSKMQLPPKSNILNYIWFDFHHETKQKGKWNNLSKLITQFDNDCPSPGYFCRLASGQVSSYQVGVIRTNCMDNLDRTNVVQSLFGRRSLLLQLGKSKALDGQKVLDTPWKPFEKVYKSIWANNANAISQLYAGTGALKVDFTKTGKRTLKGIFNDGVNSCMRYYINNFTDGVKQDSIDLLLGIYRPDYTSPSPFVERPRKETVTSNLTKAFAFMMILFTTSIIFCPRYSAATDMLNSLSYYLLISFLITLLFVSYTTYLLVKKGSKLGERLVVLPKLVPEIIEPN